MVPAVDTNSAIIQTVFTVLRLSHIFFCTVHYIHYNCCCLLPITSLFSSIPLHQAIHALSHCYSHAYSGAPL